MTDATFKFTLLILGIVFVIAAIAFVVWQIRLDRIERRKPSTRVPLIPPAPIMPDATREEARQLYQARILKQAKRQLTLEQ
jgi:hypothetical protein